MNLGGLLTGLLGSMDGGKPERTRCVWVFNLPEEYVDADVLCNIFGNFGNVQRIKFSEKKPDGALIELDDPRGAMKAVWVMNKKKLCGQEISVAHTKIEFAPVKADDTKSKDFRKAKETWRYAKENKFRAICLKRLRTLTPKLMVSNIPEGKMNDVKKYIVENGFIVKGIEEALRESDNGEKPKTGFMAALVELESIEEAIRAMGKLHRTWPTIRNFGSKKVDKFENSRGLSMSFMSPPREKRKA
jgi:RNA recognition motif-containing protein